mmetsp:Transcript_6967/g.24776  ORF Transcript_6967/g.24776 Transcript_6967/m.24776 type:complete len:220 (-) Transcript_6967:899-1558(-)
MDYFAASDAFRTSAADASAAHTEQILFMRGASSFHFLTPDHVRGGCGAVGADGRLGEPAMPRPSPHYNFGTSAADAAVDEDRAALFAALGIDAAKHVYLCPQMAFKFNPSFDAALRGIVEADADALLVFVWGKSRIRQQRAILARLGLRERVLVLDHMPVRRFLFLMRHADAVLDPFPCALHAATGRRDGRGAAAASRQSWIQARTASRARVRQRLHRA